VLDGKAIGDVFHVFDLLILDGQDIRARSYKKRQTELINLLGTVQQRAIRFAETAYTAEQKIRMHATLQAAGKEGIVFKRLDAPYTPGRPNSGGPQLKHKFYATLSAVVSKINAQRSVEVRLCGKDGWHPAGNVTIPPNHRIPVVGRVVEVRYLYATDAGILYQPTFLGERPDVDLTECVRSQLKFKPAAAEVA
jgi:bifunctional non-homologous end joining protein LigD